MNLVTLLALFALTLTDPSGDAIGDGELTPPTSPVYANVAMFDLQGVTLDVNDAGEATLQVTMGALGASVPGGGREDAAASEADEDVAAAQADTVDEALRLEEAGQFDVSGMLAVIDVYLDSGEGGADQTLSGPNMLLPSGSGWQHAVRISAEGAWGVTYAGAVPEQADPGPEEAEAQDGAVPTTDPTEAAEDGAVTTEGAGEVALESEVPADLTEAVGEVPQVLSYVPLNIVRSGNVLSMALPWTFDPEGQVDVFAMTGVHDPFSPDGWRPISASPSPWAFSGGQQVTPVIDLLAQDQETQAAALRRGVLPAPERAEGGGLPFSPWLWVMAGGVALALVGLVLRGRVPAPVTQPEVAEGAEGATEVGSEADTGAARDPVAAADEAPADQGPVEAGESGGTGDTGDTGHTGEPGDTGDDLDVASTLLAFDTDEGQVAPDPRAEAPEDVPDESPEELPDAAPEEVPGETPEEDAAEPSIEPPTEPAASADEVGEAGEVDDGALVVDDSDPEPSSGSEAAAAPSGASPSEGVRTPRSAFSTAVDHSFLVGEGSEDDGLFGDVAEDGESFWHPASRSKKAGARAPAASAPPASEDEKEPPAE